jgi:glycolate oxidase FAD binding subunit
MSQTIAPKSAQELADVIAGRNAPVEIIGSGTNRGLGRPLKGLAPLSMKAFAGIALYDPAELIIEAGAATPLAEIEKTLAAKNQQLAFEPPVGGTIGGAVACNLSGPRRIKAGALRDHLLMVEGVSGRGEVFKAGARVVKNVTGYDLPKLMAGSYGTLAALTSVTLKVMPKPETEATLIVPDQTIAAAVATMTAALQSPNEVSGAAHVPGTGTLLRIEGIGASVAFRMARLRHMFPSGELAEASPWAAVRDHKGISGEIQWRISLPPSAAPAYLAALGEKLSFDVLLDWGGGLIWLSCKTASDGHAASIRSLLPSGHATLVAAPDEVRARVPVFQPQPPALAALTRKVKEAYDPKGILNPGRMYEGL